MLDISAESPLTLVDGRTVIVRPTAEADAEGIRALFEGLSPQSRAMRFGAARGGLTLAEAAQMASPPGPTGAGLVVLAGSEHGRVVALARYERVRDAPDAEFAVTVADPWHRLGVGTGLVEGLLAQAERDGLEALWATVRPGNEDMLGLLRRLGCTMERVATRDETLVRLLVGHDAGLEEATIARFARAAAASLEPLMRPRSIAVVGASRSPHTVGGAVLEALLTGEYRGGVYPVNRAAREVQGRPAFPSLAAVTEPVDLVVVAVPAQEVPAVARQASARGARAMIVLSAGFSEATPGGAALEAELLHVVRTGGMRLVGPNCLGVASSDPAAPFDATFAPASPPEGSVALASQSGGVAAAALAYCAQHGLGLSAFVSLGNTIDVGPEDLLAWWEGDPRTRVILLYLEGLEHPRRFGVLARRVARTTPVVVLKAGRGPAGRRGAGSHTAALAAGEAPTDALFDLAGVVRVETAEELFETGELIAAQPLPAGERVAILSNAGGPGILAADACEAHGLSVPSLSPGLRSGLRAAVKGLAGDSNPVDLGAGASTDDLLRAGRLLAGSGEVDAVLIVVVRIRGVDHTELCLAAAQLADGPVPVIGCLVGGRPPETPLGGQPVPWLRFPESAARALAHACSAAAAARRPADPARRPQDVDRAAARRALATAGEGDWLAAEAVEALLAAYGIAMPRSVEVTGAGDAAAAQAEIGGPVAVKVARPVLAHKTELGGVVLGCASPEAAAAAYGAVADALERGGGGPLEAAIVQEMAEPGVELIVGSTADPAFGPLVLAGMGGTEAEVWADRAVALAPVGPRTALDLWDRLRGTRLLDGWRGGPAADRGTLADLVARVSWLAADQPQLAELDLNPVRAPVGGRALVLDAAARRAGPSAEPVPPR